MTAEDVLRLHTDGFNRALREQDYAALEAICSERYMLVRPDESVLSKEQVLRDLREQGLTFHRMDLQSPVVRVFGSAAILTVESTTVSSRNGKDGRRALPHCCVYGQEGDTIRLVHVQSTMLSAEISTF